MPLSISMACEKFERGPDTTRAVTLGTSPAKGRFSDGRQVGELALGVGLLDGRSPRLLGELGDRSRSFSSLQVLVVGDAVPGVAHRAT